MLTRSCPKCTTEMSYQSKGAYKTAIDRNSTCRKCASKASGFTDRYATKGANTGDSNAFYGKKHTKVFRKNLSILHTGMKHTEETKRKVSINNGRGMTGKSVYDVWLQKHGKEKADRLLKLKRKRNSTASKGKNNSMYGKPSPNGSGNGWKGWYDGTFFRSLRELTFLLQIQDKKWETGETLSIPYSYLGRDRTYRPDFIIEDEVVEIKPERLHKAESIQAKTRAAKAFCKKIGKTYRLVDPGMVEFTVLDDLVNKGRVIIHERYKQRYETYKETHSVQGASGVG